MSLLTLGATRVEGTFRGDLVSGGTLLVGPLGFVRADLAGFKEVVCYGRLKGSISAHRVALKGKAVVVGDITANVLSVDDKASVLGKLTVEDTLMLGPYDTPRSSDQ